MTDDLAAEQEIWGKFNSCRSIPHGRKMTNLPAGNARQRTTDSTGGEWRGVSPPVRTAEEELNRQDAKSAKRRPRKDKREEWQRRPGPNGFVLHSFLSSSFSWRSWRLGG
jgi:hypothetical protein